MTKTATKKSSTQGASDREIVITRVFDAPRERVFEAWADLEQKAKWWGPNGFSFTTKKYSFKPGGTWLFTMHGPDGADYPSKTVFEEIIRPERIVYTHSGGKKGSPGVLFHATITFKDLGNGKTELTMRSVFPTAEARDTVVKVYKAIEGGNQTLARLAEHLAKKPAFELVLTHVIEAPASRVFKAWSEPKQVAQWFAPDGFTLPVCEMDFRVGGTFHMTMHGFGMEHPFSGTYRVIEPPKRLVWTGEFPGGPRDQIHTEVTFEEQGSKTKITVRQTFAVILPADKPKIKGAKQGWTQTLNHLTAFAEKA